jgi:hypothetical protein
VIVYLCVWCVWVADFARSCFCWWTSKLRMHSFSYYAGKLCIVHQRPINCLHNSKTIEIKTKLACWCHCNQAITNNLSVAALICFAFLQCKLCSTARKKIARFCLSAVHVYARRHYHWELPCSYRASTHPVPYVLHSDLPWCKQRSASLDRAKCTVCTVQRSGTLCYTLATVSSHHAVPGKLNKNRLQESPDRSKILTCIWWNNDRICCCDHHGYIKWISYKNKVNAWTLTENKIQYVTENKIQYSSLPNATLSNRYAMYHTCMNEYC